MSELKKEKKEEDKEDYFLKHLQARDVPEEKKESNEIRKKRFQELVDFYLERKEEWEANLERVLKENDELNITYCIINLSSVIMLKKHFELSMEGKIREAMDYMNDFSNLEKIKKDIRIKTIFRVSK